MSVQVQQASELLERDAELAAIAGLIGGAAGGKSGALFVEGAAGIGKTGLLAAVDELGRDAPVRVLRARGGELERSFPFGVVRQLFGPAVGALDPGRRASVLSGAAELAADLVDPHAPAPAADFGSQEALHPRLHGLYWLCAGLAAQQPLVLMVDDAHWADDPSLQWLLFMARRLGDMPIALLLSARPARADAWPQPLVLLRNEPQLTLIRPQPLTEHASGILIDRLLGVEAEKAFAAASHKATGGNPFFLSALVASVRADGIAPTEAAASQVLTLAPEAITRSIVVRLDRMPVHASALARCVAVLGTMAELRHAAALARLGLAEAAVAADALAAGGLLDAGRPLRLAHPVVRTALYSEIAEGERAQLHARAARMLSDEDADPDAIAAHLLASEPAGDRWTTELLLSAAERALTRGSPRTSDAYLRRALAEPPPAGDRALVLRRLGIVETVLGNPTGAEHVRQAMQRSREVRHRAELAFDLSVACLVAGRSAEAIDAIEGAIQQTEESDQELRWRLEAQMISLARLDTVHAEVARRHLRRIPRDLPGATPGERLILAELAYDALLAGAPVDVVAGLARRAFGGGRLITEHPRGTWSVLNAIFALVGSEQHESAMQAYNELIQRTQREGSPISFALLSAQRSTLHYLRGAIPDAIADVQAAISAGRHFGHSRLAPNLYAALIAALLEAGDTDGAEQALADSGLGDEAPDTLLVASLIRSRGRLRLAQGKTQAGIDDTLHSYRLVASLGITNPFAAPGRSTAAVALARLSRRDEAHKLVAGELAAARRFGAHSTVGISLRAAGVIEGGRAGIAHLRDAVAHLERSPARLEHARALCDLGAALRRSGNRREAQQSLRQALDLADRCGAKAVANQARAELLITGARPRRTRITGADALTPSERRVAQLAAEGLTNRQIAQALFVSHHTVVTHLRHCYQKLNISSRAQLTSALDTHPADEP